MNSVLEKKIDDYFTRFKHQKFKKGEILIRADDDPLGIFYLKNGIVKKYAISKKGDELIVNLFKPVSYFPMSWAINDTPNEYYYEAMTDVEVWRVPREKAVAFIKDNPDIMFDLLARLYNGTDGMITRMTYLMAGNAYTRLITELLISVKRFGKKTGSGDELEVAISEKDIANQAGMSRETVSREMKHLKNKGIVVIEKSTLKVKSLAALEYELATTP
jgi:CRP-like cAMP-binding protein